VTIQVRRATDRFVTRDQGRTTCHSFSFGAHFDPDNVGFGAITAHNEEQLPPGTGYPDHPHRDVEIVTLVLDGALRHTDSEGHATVLLPGGISRTSAGTGIVHAEVTEPGIATRFLQTWLRPDAPGGASSYCAAEVGRPDALSEVAGPDGVVQIGTTGARLHVGDLAAGQVALPDAPLLHVFSVGATVAVGDRELLPNDAARLTDEGSRDLVVEVPGLVLVWSFVR
jgi:redox-sensitive bicupin YhaK (pirin superfamily)